MQFVGGHGHVWRLFDDAVRLREIAEALVAPFRGEVSKVAGIESRGFILGRAAALALGVGFVRVRKAAGLFPGPKASVETELDYRGNRLMPPLGLGVVDPLLHGEVGRRIRLRGLLRKNPSICRDFSYSLGDSRLASSRGRCITGASRGSRSEQCVPETGVRQVIRSAWLSQDSRAVGRRVGSSVSTSLRRLFVRSGSIDDLQHRGLELLNRGVEVLGLVDRDRDRDVGVGAVEDGGAPEAVVVPARLLAD